MGDQSRRMVRQSQRSEQENGQTKPGIRAGSATNQTGTGTGLQEQDTGPRRKHTPRQSLQVWPSLKYTSISSFRCLAGCKVESLIAGGAPAGQPWYCSP
ncbi:unnamed protein product [Staurois parvus]|uniref:Uncharacterized protein n=1 Tax=Staurois parvus TaxID=386267 RepID=A0ABN9H8Y9_9NEOB|nr:unnamed protein product [Staurois parvus]